MSTRCQDCGIDPWDFIEGGRRVHEDFYVHNDLWDQVCPDDNVVTYPNGAREGTFQMCIGCFEKRLGRELTRDDLKGRLIDLFGTPPSKRLVERWGPGVTVGRWTWPCFEH